MSSRFHYAFHYQVVKDWSSVLFVLALINQAPASAQKDGTYFARLRVLKR
jgi:hypothetical protein